MRPPPYGKRVRGGRSFPQSRKKEDSRYMIVNLIIGSLMIGSVYGMLALGYSLIYSASGLMTFTQGQLLMLGAFLGLQFYKNMGMPFIVAFLLTVVIMFLLGLALEKFLIRLLLNK